MKSPKIKHLEKRCRAAVPTKSVLGTVWVHKLARLFVRLLFADANGRHHPGATGQRYVVLRRRFAAALDGQPTSAQPGAP
jgi:hypothetical protein